MSFWWGKGAYEQALRALETTRGWYFCKQNVKEEVELWAVSESQDIASSWVCSDVFPATRAVFIVLHIGSVEGDKRSGNRVHEPSISFSASLSSLSHFRVCVFVFVLHSFLLPFICLCLSFINFFFLSRRSKIIYLPLCLHILWAALQNYLFRARLLWPSSFTSYRGRPEGC